MERDASKISDAGFSKKSLTEILWVAFPKILSGVGLLGLNLLLLRAWGPEKFGLVSVCLTGVILLDTVFGSAIDMAIFRLAPLAKEENPELARQLEFAGLILKPIASFVLLPPLLLLSPWMSGVFFQREDQANLIILSYIALLGILLVRSAQVHFQIERLFRHYGTTDLLHSIFRFGVIAIALYADVATPVSVLGIMAGGSFAVAVLTLLTSAKPVLQVSFNLDALKKLISVVQWYLATVIVGSMIGRMDVFWVSALAGVKEAGVYGAAQLFALLPQLLGIYMSAVFSPRILPMWKRGELQSTYGKFQKILTGAALMMLIAAIGGISLVKTWILPENYQEAAPIILWLLPAGLASFVTFPWTIPLLLYARPRLLLIVDCIALPLLSFAYWVVVPQYGILGAAVVNSGFGLVRTAFYLVLANRILQVDPEGKQWASTAAAGNQMQFVGSSS